MKAKSPDNTATTSVVGFLLSVNIVGVKKTYLSIAYLLTTFAKCEFDKKNENSIQKVTNKS